MKYSHSEIEPMIQEYAHEVFAQQLTMEGFAHPQDDYCHWYRIINRQVVQSVYFSYRSQYLAAVVDVGFGCHPLFTEPLFPRTAYMCSTPSSNEVYFEYPNLAENNCVFSDNCLVMHPDDNCSSTDLLEQRVLSKFRQIKTIQECYLFHRDFWFGENLENLWANQMLLPTFFDEVIWVEDKAVYQRCAKRIEDYEQSWVCTTQKKKKLLEKMLVQKIIFQGAARERYVDFLRAKANKTQTKLERVLGDKVHISV